MTTLTATFFSGTSLRSRFETFRAQLDEKVAKRKIYQTTLKELEQCSARDLQDLGIAPSSIQQIAHEAAYGA
ncbi:hypothetical protein OAN307_c10930 [Octadecabacter antarcticus 307]|uniref:YjiS-like domain-containing protein n=1 Tax=Octadecabacter antarcticus 307 TaxID=391626 RepID=M9R4V2_9RHOB|nr:DUF1127 domain-containing protein [Octadecabacter antarcticus]AGI66798.1 hypothetical protein OAN307_c10930 [Octadecabacter antarcticus 307]